MRKILITGGCGFIGFHLARKLLEDNFVVILDNNSNDLLKKKRLFILSESPNHKFVDVDIIDRKSLSKVFSENKFDIAIHLAAIPGVRQSIENPMEYVNVNVNGFMNVLEECRKNDVKLLFASSSSVYGNAKLPFEVGKESYPLSPYASTKRCDEILAETYANLYGMDITALRFFTVYGPFGRPDMFYYSASMDLINNQRIKLFNNGNNIRDYTYIDDVVECVSRILNDFPRNYYVTNIGSEMPVSTTRFVKVLSDCLANVELFEGDVTKLINCVNIQPGESETTFADMNSFYRRFGYKPETRIEIGLNKFAEWLKENV